MNRTNAVDVSIHDVSPELSSSAEILNEISNTNSVEINIFTSAPKIHIYNYMQSLCHINNIYLLINCAKKREELYVIALL